MLEKRRTYAVESYSPGSGPVLIAIHRREVADLFSSSRAKATFSSFCTIFRIPSFIISHLCLRARVDSFLRGNACFLAPNIFNCEQSKTRPLKVPQITKVVGIRVYTSQLRLCKCDLRFNTINSIQFRDITDN